MKTNSSFVILILLLSSIISSCSKILDQEPQTDVSDNKSITDKKTALSALYGVYDNLQSYSSAIIIALDVASDNVVPFEDQNNIVPYRDVTTSTGAPFSAFYVTINRANFIIKRVPTIVDNQFTKQERDQVIGEAYFLRALTYFDLARFYGGVQIVTEPSERIDTHIGTERSSLDETYGQVLSDLNQAEQLITNTQDRSRASIYAVYALKARLYLYTKQWEQAEEYASKVIADQNFSLVKPFSSFYTGNLTREAIFELIFTEEDNTTFWRSWLSPADGGNQTYIPTPHLIESLLDPSKGGSRAAVIKESTIEADKGVWNVQLYGKTNGTSSIFVLRLAEQYLIRAEARAKKNTPDLQGAVSDINAIQARADISPLFVLPSSASLSVIEQAIENERQLELAFEGHRFNDIIRTGRVADVFESYNPLLKESYQWLFPIPESSIQKDPYLTQNPGYQQN